MSKLNIGLLYGGKSTEHEVSMRSAESILTVLDTDKYNITLIHISKSGEWLHVSGNDKIADLSEDESAQKLTVRPSGQLAGLAEGKKLDVVIPVLHGTFGEDGTVQGLLELAEIPYVGCNVRSSAVCMDKDMTKRLLKLEGIGVAESVLFKHHEKDDVNFAEVEEKLGLPMFVKPVNQGSSVGVSKVTDEASFHEALALAFQFDTKVIVESALDGREVEVSVLGNSNPFVSVPGEIIPDDGFYSYDSKYTDENGASLEIPAKIDGETVQNLQNVALKTFETLDCEGMARVDMFLCEDGSIFVNEVNTFPGFTSISMYPKLLEASGVSYDELVDRLIRLALERHQLESGLTTDFS